MSVSNLAAEIRPLGYHKVSRLKIFAYHLIEAFQTYFMPFNSLSHYFRRSLNTRSLDRCYRIITRAIRPNCIFSKSHLLLTLKFGQCAILLIQTIRKYLGECFTYRLQKKKKNKLDFAMIIGNSTLLQYLLDGYTVPQECS